MSVVVGLNLFQQCRRAAGEPAARERLRREVGSE
jgi:hypothetical protein